MDLFDARPVESSSLSAMDTEVASAEAKEARREHPKSDTYDDLDHIA